MYEGLAAEHIRRAKVLLHSSNAKQGAGFQQHSKMGSLRDWIAEVDIFCFFWNPAASFWNTVASFSITAMPCLQQWTTLGK
jgi:hypothetical protein